MPIGKFYFLEGTYFKKYKDDKLMGSKENVGGKLSGRPCYYSFYDTKTGIIWLIPISSRVDKYKKIHAAKLKKYGHCNTIVFGDVLGHEKAFLIQNMCPCISKYLREEYVDTRNNNSPVQVSEALKQELSKKAKKALALQKRGIKLIFPDVLAIEEALIKELNGF